MFDDLKSKENTSEQPVKSEPLKPLGANSNQSLGNSSNKGLNQTSSLVSPIKTDKEFSARMDKLEEVGKKRGKINKVYSVVGIIAICIISMGAIYGVNYCLTDVIDITSKSNENMVVANNKKSNMDVKINSNWKSCSMGSDCVVVQAGCCDCNNGGQQSSINSNYLTDWEIELNEKCQEINCPAIADCRSGEAVCENGNCQFKEESECVTEGNIIDYMENNDKNCCDGLKKLDVYNEKAGECLIQENIAVCTYCSNGICDLGENECNCPKDCTEEENATSSQEILKNELNEDVLVEEDSAISTVELNCVCGDEECGNEKNSIKTDNDGDGLFDFQEIVCGTDIDNPDSDGDGYNDGDEVKNGYNPNGSGKLLN